MTWSDSKPIISKTQYEIDVAAPYRLGFTVSALRRLSTSIVDLLTLEDEYVRALNGFRKPALHKHSPLPLPLPLRGVSTMALAIVRRFLGVDLHSAQIARCGRRQFGRTKWQV